MVNLEGVDVFVKVVQAGSFTRAAEQLAMPTTTVSAKVARLERSLGVTLIQRTTRKLNVTPAGQAYFERCLRAIEELQEAEAQLASTSREPQGLLRITASADVGHSILPDLVRAYLKRYPQTRIELLVTNRVVDLVAEGVDLAIRAGELEDSSLIARKFLPVDGGLWASPAYLRRKGIPRHPRELAEHDWLTFSALPGGRVSLADGRETFEIERAGRIEADDLETLRLFMVRGEGIGVLPEFLARDPNRVGKLEPVLPKWRWNGGGFSFVYPAQRFVPLKVQAFIALTLEAGARQSSAPKL